MKKNSDKEIQELTRIVNSEKEAIAKAEKPNWKTNCSFRYSKESSASINLQACGSIDDLVNILAFLYEKHDSHKKASIYLGLDTEFKWFGFTLEEWAYDIKTRVDKINITLKKDKLEILESRLNKLMSPELKVELELEEIKKSLGL